MYNEVEYLTSIVTGVVTHPDMVNVERIEDEMGILLTLQVHANDMGAIIGHEGKTATGIRTLLRQHGRRNNKTISLKIKDPE